jgi:hypothetical protein
VQTCKNILLTDQLCLSNQFTRRLRTVAPAIHARLLCHSLPRRRLLHRLLRWHTLVPNWNLTALSCSRTRLVLNSWRKSIVDYVKVSICRCVHPAQEYFHNMNREFRRRCWRHCTRRRQALIRRRCVVAVPPAPVVYAEVVVAVAVVVHAVVHTSTMQRRPPNHRRN